MDRKINEKEFIGKKRTQNFNEDKNAIKSIPNEKKRSSIKLKFSLNQMLKEDNQEQDNSNHLQSLNDQFDIDNNDDIELTVSIHNETSNEKSEKKNDMNNVKQKNKNVIDSDESDIINELLNKKKSKLTKIEKNNRDFGEITNKDLKKNSNFGIKFTKNKKKSTITVKEVKRKTKNFGEEINSLELFNSKENSSEFEEDEESSYCENEIKKTDGYEIIDLSSGKKNSHSRRKEIELNDDKILKDSDENKDSYQNYKKNSFKNDKKVNDDFIKYKNIEKNTHNKKETHNSNFKNNKNDKHIDDLTTADFIAFKKVEEKDDSKEESDLIDLSTNYGERPLFHQYPWISKRTSEYKGMIKLHFEICDFYNYIKPKPHEYEIRKKSFEILKNLLLSKFPNWRIKSFGSFPNEIFLADSDVDIVVISNQKKDDPRKTLEKIYDYLYNNHKYFDYMRKIDAKVPIIKLQLKETKINLDISVDRKNGYDAKRIIKRSINDFHALKPLLYVLKYFIRQKKLNETFTGGVSSFLLFNLVLAFLQYKTKTENNINNGNTNQLNLGHLLVDFFQFYGFEFNYDEIGISVRYGGFFYKKKDKDIGKPAFLSVENFQDSNQNIGSGSYKFRKILDCFKQARDGLYYPSVYPIISYIGQFITTDSFLRNRFKANED